MKLQDILSGYMARGETLRNEDMYNEAGTIRVYSATTTGPVGYYNNYNYTLKNTSFIISLNGANAGYVSIGLDHEKVWITSDCGVLELRESYIREYPKEVLALWIQDFCVKSRKVNGTQPKFYIASALGKEIDVSVLKKIASFDFSEANLRKRISNKIHKYYCEIEVRNSKREICFKNFIDSFFERGDRLVQGRDLYNNYGTIKVISSTTTGEMGFYNRANYLLGENDVVYAIDGANAGYVSVFKKGEVFITDHAGVITVKEEYVKKYGRIAIAIFLQDYFVKMRNANGTQPTFMLKNNLNIMLDLSILDVLAKMKLDEA